jgi:predicted transposase/invertase (TIGR01784 family)
LQKTGRHLKSIEIIEAHRITSEITDKKDSILDVRATTDDNIHINVEVQMRSMGLSGNMMNRSLYYWGKDFVTSLDSGDEYNKLPTVICINIVNYEYLKKVDDFHLVSRMRIDDHPEYISTTALEIHFIDLVKFRRLKDKDINNPLHRWLIYLNKNTKTNILKEVIEMDPAIQAAERRFQEVLSDKETHMAYTRRMMALSDYNSGIANSRKEGEEIGIKKGEEIGIKKGQIEMAKKMKALNTPLSFIHETTGLSIEEIERL